MTTQLLATQSSTESTFDVGSAHLNYQFGGCSSPHLMDCEIIPILHIVVPLQLIGEFIQFVEEEWIVQY